MRRARPSAVAVAVAVVLLSGCNLKAHAIDPFPDVKDSRGPIEGVAVAFQVADSVDDMFILRNDYGIQTIDIRNWHQGFKLGFKRRFANEYRVVDRPEAAQVQVLLEETEIDLLPEDFNDDGSVSTFKAMIRWRARLFGENLAPIGEIEEVAPSRDNFRGIDDVSSLFADCVEVAMNQLAPVLHDATAQIAKTPRPADVPDEVTPEALK